MLADFSNIFCPKKTLIASPPLSGHTRRAHNASSRSRFKPYGKQERLNARGDENRNCLRGYRVGLVRDQLFCVSSQAAVTGLF